MIDPIQILFAVVITTLTILLVVIGIEIYRILQDAKKTLVRVNDVLDNVETITESIAGPVEKMSGLVEGFHQGMGVVNLVTKIIEARAKKAEK